MLCLVTEFTASCCQSLSGAPLLLTDQGLPLSLVFSLSSSAMWLLECWCFAGQVLLCGISPLTDDRYPAVKSCEAEGINIPAEPWVTWCGTGFQEGGRTGARVEACCRKKIQELLFCVCCWDLVCCSKGSPCAAGCGRNIPATGCSARQGTDGKGCPALAVNRLWTKPPAERLSSELLTNRDLMVQAFFSKASSEHSSKVSGQSTQLLESWSSPEKVFPGEMQHPALWEALKKRRLGQEEVGSTQEDRGGGVWGQSDFQVQFWGSPGKCSSQHWEGQVFSEQGGVDALCQTLTCLLSP